MRRAAARTFLARFGIAAMLLVAAVVALPIVALASGYFKHYYVPSEGMAPTLLKNDRLIASTVPTGEPRRGDIILFKVGEGMYIQRIAALPGDRIALKAGIIILNGRPVPQRFVRDERAEGALGPAPARRLAEQFPGEAAPHHIYDFGPAMFDDVPEQAVAPGHLFVLGDNRDRSADSRVPREQMGVEQLPVGDVSGRALFRTFGPGGRIGERLGR